MYVIHLNWDDFFEQAEEHRRVVYVQPYVETKTHMGVTIGHHNQIILSYCDREHQVVHAARIKLEFVDTFGMDGMNGAAPAEAEQRLDLALSIVEQTLWNADLQTRRGMLLATGLREDLERTVCQHQLWKWAGNLKDVRERRLLPMEEKE
jgi:hypothetical protein